MNDTIKCQITNTPVTIDGQANEDCWAKAEWHNIDQVWIPYNAVMKPGDFAGKFKLAWDKNYLYLLAEIVDDSLSDDHADPLQNYWDDDALEVFVDENRSMGDHERNYNAFAYHVSLFYDAIDISPTGAGINLKNNIKVKMDTIGDHTYLWELAIKNYSADFDPNNPDASYVTLYPNKLMGFALAYCDNDETLARENFIGSMVMTAAHANDMYKNADYFGPILLVDPDYVGINDTRTNQNRFNIYPNPANDYLTIDSASPVSNGSVIISSIEGKLINTLSLDKGNKVYVGELNAGVYLVTIKSDKLTESKIFNKL